MHGLACTALLDDVMDRFCCEVRLAQLPESLWQLASPRDCRCILDCLAAVWDSLMTLVAYSAGLVNVKPVNDARPVPPAIRQSFQDLLAACKRRNRVSAGTQIPPTHCSNMQRNQAELLLRSTSMKSVLDGALFM